MQEFTPGLTLSGAFFQELVSPLLAEAWPPLRYGAARLGSGSEVLGYDTPLSMDHDWGPQLTIFLASADAARAPALASLLDNQLPATFRGYPVRFVRSDQNDAAPRHRVEITTVAAFVTARLGLPLTAPPTAGEWLTFPQQRLLELTAGAVYRDDDGELTRLRDWLRWYPDDVWRLLLAAGWSQLGQEEHLHARAGLVGDALGASLIASSLARTLMQLAFLQEQRYAPYAKWFGTAFARLAAAPALHEWLMTLVSASDWPARQTALVTAASWLAARQNALGLSDPVDPAPRPFHDRPFLVIDGARIAAALAATVRDPAVAALFGRQPLGGIDQVTTQTNLLVAPARCRALAAAFAAGDEPLVRPD